MSYTYEFPRPSVTTDILVFSIRDGVLQVLLIERKLDPFKGAWAIPGGFVQMDEDLATGALRELEEETGLSGIPIRQLGAYGAPDRDPRGRVITVAFLALVPSDDLQARGGSDAEDARWFPVDDLPPLAFDHAQILADGRAELARDVTASIHDSALVAFDFLPETFTLSQAQQVFETLRGEEMDKRNFRKWLTNEWAIEDTGEKSTGGRHRPAALFRLERD
ncbi:NUDIX domain-containing protein [Rhodobacterales bacterium HKCCE4037]|nr:NUDIX domain-containing protein [Rhodobacterales bacterium HKCCE4037]